MALLNPGDEVLVFEPFYGYHVNTLKSLRVNPVLVALAEPDFHLDADDLRAAVTPQTRAVLLNTPANPSGKIFLAIRTRTGCGAVPAARSLPDYRRDL
jgi:aminotransferase